MIELKKRTQTSNLQYQQKCKYTSVNHTARVKEVQMRTQMDWQEIFFQREQTLQIKQERFSKIQRWINERP